MKIKYLLFSFLNFIFLISITNASEYYYINDNGVSLNQEEYKYVISMFSTEFVNSMTLEDYNNIIVNNDISSNIEVKKVEQLISPCNTEFSSGNKTLYIAKSCSSGQCLISLTLKWNSVPSIKSYDVFGSRFDGSIDYVIKPITKVTTDEKSYNVYDVNYFSNGYGVSVKLPSTGNNFVITQYFTVSGSGTIYSSYQHAKKGINESQSKKYNISQSGYGNVFNFENSVKDYYDAMNGVFINL